MLIAKHTIDLGKSFINPSSFMLTKDSKRLLSTNYKSFIDTYGTHYIAGAMMGCDMNINIKKTLADG